MTVEDNPSVKCTKCDKLRPDIQSIAERLQIENASDNFKVGKVDCRKEESFKICEYFNTKNVPTVIVLRQDLNEYFQMWMFANNMKSY